DSIPRRETWLAAFGPVGVLTMFAFWRLALVLGYSLLIDGFRTGIEPVPDTFGTSLYFSPLALVPLRTADLVPIGVGPRTVSVGEPPRVSDPPVFPVEPRQRGVAQLLRGCHGCGNAGVEHRPGRFRGLSASHEQGRQPPG